MKSRITIVVVAASLFGMLNSPLKAQPNAYPPGLPVSFGEPVERGADMTSAQKEPVTGDGTWGLHGIAGRRPRLFRPPHYWVTAESLLWFGKGRTMPALVTTSPAGTAQGDAGVLGQPGTQVLFGDGQVGDGLAAGARIDFGFWLDPCETLGVGAKVWGLQGAEESFSAAGTGGSPILARPFYNINLLPEREDALLVVYPGVFDEGSIHVETSSDVIGTEAYLRTSIMSGRGYNLDLMGGYHFVRLDDRLTIQSSAVAAGGDPFTPVDTLVEVMDSFETRNEFHGGEIGTVGEIRYDRWTFSGLAKISVGNMHQVVYIDGSAVTTPPSGDPTTRSGGLLALGTNMSSTVGPHSRDRTAIIPEVGMTLAYKWREHLRLTVGYSAIYWNSAVLAGDQIDRTINDSQIDGPLIGDARPEFTFQETDYWMHGLNLGATLIY